MRKSISLAAEYSRTEAVRGLPSVQKSVKKIHLCILHTSSAVPQMLLGQDCERVGGAELQLAEIARQLSQRGWPVTFAFESHGHKLETSTVAGVRLLSVDTSSASLPIARFFTHTLPGNWRLIAQANADVYLQMGVGWQNALLAWACRKANRKFILWLASITDPVCHKPGHWYLRAHERWLAHYGLKHADIIVAQTRDQQRLLHEHHSRDSVLIRNVWPMKAEEYVAPGGTPKVFWAATMRALKRPHLFLDVAAALPNIRFMMAGVPAEDSPELYQEVEARAKTMPNVDFLGFVPFRQIDKYYAEASAYLCTSTIEGFPNTFLQAWSHGRPVVSTFDPDEVICEHNLGFHCQDFDELVTAVRTACENSSDYAGQVRAYLRTYHSPEVIIPQIERLLWEE